MSSAPIRILRLTTRLNISGPAIQASLLTARMSAPDYESLLACGRPAPSDGDTAFITGQYDIEPIFVDGLRRSLNPFTQIIVLIRLIQLIRQYRPDVVHTHTTTAGFLGRLAAKLCGVPVIVHTLHWHPFQGYYRGIQTTMFILLERIGARFSDSIITLSETLRRELVDTYQITRRSRIIVLPLGMDLDAFAQTKRKQNKFRQHFDIPADVPLIGMVGRIFAVKNHSLFVHMAAEILKTYPDAHFVIVGDGEDRPAIENLIQQMGLNASFTITGWWHDMLAVYSDLDLLVNTSYNEGTPIPIIEALAAACPVIATQVGGSSDLLDSGKLGRLVPTDDLPALIAAVFESLAQPLDPTIGQQKMIDRYGIDRLVSDLNSLYRGLLANKKTQ